VTKGGTEKGRKRVRRRPAAVNKGKKDEKKILRRAEATGWGSTKNNDKRGSFLVENPQTRKRVPV